MPVVHGWDAAGVRTYGQYCPIARAADLLAERWSIVILRNVLLGCRTFNEIADGAPGLSRGLLSRRLRELDRAGVIEIRPKPGGPGSLYEPTAAGRELSEVMLALQNWGAKWATLTPEHAHPGVVLWGWVTYCLDRDHLPEGVATLVEVPAMAISSTDCRTRVAEGRPVWYLVPDGVVQYISKRGLYQPDKGSKTRHPF